MSVKIIDVKYDCKHFRGHIPCKPNKAHDVTCPDCRFYQPITKRILIIKLGALGDVIRTTPLAVRYKELYPNCHITWLTWTPDILPKHEIDTIYKYNETSLYVLENVEFDLAINLDKEPEACILLQKIKATEKYGFGWNGAHIIPVNTYAEHKLITGFFDGESKANTKSYPEEIFEICGLDFKGEEYLLDVDPEFDAKWREKLQVLADTRKVIGLNTGCGPRWKTRLWKPENWKLLIKQIEAAGYFPMVLGGPAEDAQNHIYSEETGVYYPGTYSLQEFIAILNNCHTIVSAVSMSMHIAVGLKKQLVLFNNIFNSNEFDLYGRGEIIEPTTGCDCFYGAKCTRERHCMEDISVPRVTESVRRLTEQNT